MGRALRRIARITGASVCAAIGCAVVAAGALDQASGMRPDLWGIMLVATILILVSATVAHRMRFRAPTARAQRVSRWLAVAPVFADIELGLALALGATAVINVTGGLDSHAYPLLYGVVAFAATFLSGAGAWVTVVAALALESAAAIRLGTRPGMVSAVAHGAAIGGAALAHAIFLRGLAAQMRRGHVQRMEDEVRAQRDSARDYRLIGASLGAESRARSRADEELMLAVGGANNIGAAVYHLLVMLKRSLDAHTCILLWLEPSAEWLKIKERVSDSDAVLDSGRVRATGCIGAVIRDREPVRLANTKPGQVSYLESDQHVGAFLGVPVIEDQHLRGVVCVDRDEAFAARDVDIASECCDQILRAIQAERVFRAVERGKYEHERFYHASAMLGRALTMEQVMETAFDATAQIVEYDVGVFTSYRPERKRHRVHNIRVNPGGDKMLDLRQLANLEFRTNTGLVSMVVKNRHFLPAAGEVRENTPHVYTKRARIKAARSLLVLPLISGDEAIGTLMLATRRERAFSSDVREMLGVIAGQVAVSLQNAMMYKRMETMATTDGLTGLTNHRTFQERFAQLLERAERHDHPASILLCDVDHFKKVNDTHGHPVGDEVLRQVARVLRAAVRKIDIPARYGGEEFAVVLEATGEEGALRLADRIRTDVAKLEFDSEQGKFQVTMSVGVASFPADSRDRAELIERADHALYHAKESGRNRVVSYSQFVAARRSARAS